jgi:hypothetical protein
MEQFKNLAMIDEEEASERKAAHTYSNEVTDAVFHAPMFALNADIEANACKPSHMRSSPTESARLARVRVRPNAHAHTEAHVGAYVVQARTSDRFIYLGR